MYLKKKIYIALAALLIGASAIVLVKLFPEITGGCPDIGGVDRIDIVKRDRQLAVLTGWAASKDGLRGIHVTAANLTLAKPDLIPVNMPVPRKDGCTQRRMWRFQAAVPIGDVPPAFGKINVMGISADENIFFIQAVPFQSPGLIGNLDSKKYEAGILTIEGWALAASEVPTIRVLDRSGQEIGHADTGLSRPDVAQMWRAWSGAPTSGFKLSLPVTQATGDEVQVLAQIRSGQKVDLTEKKSR